MTNGGIHGNNQCCIEIKSSLFQIPICLVIIYFALRQKYRKYVLLKARRLSALNKNFYLANFMNLSCYTKSPERQCPSTPESCKPRGKKTIHTAKIIKKPKKKILLILIVLLLGGNYKYSCQDIYQACVLGPGDIQGT